MKRTGFSEEQIIGMIKEQESGIPTAEVCRKHRARSCAPRLLAGIGLLIDWDQPHQAHQATHPMPAALVALTLHMTGHLSRAIPGRLQKLFVDECHETQSLGTFSDRLVVKA